MVNSNQWLWKGERGDSFFHSIYLSTILQGRVFQVIITQQFYNWLLKKQDLLTFQRSEVEQAEVAPPSHCSYVLMILAQEGLLLNK